MKPLAPFLLVGALLGGCSNSDVSTPERATFDSESSTGPIATFADEDVEMNLAVRAAQRDVAVFRERLLHPTPTQRIGLKGQFGEGDHVEHMWISNPRVEGDGFSGILANEPGYLRTPKLGDPVTIDVRHVSDWYVHDDGKLQGAFTLRVMRKRLTEEDRKIFDEANGFVAE